MIASLNTVTQENTEEAKLIEIDILNALHDLANIIDGTQRYAKLLDNEIPQNSPLKNHSESIRKSLDSIGNIHKSMIGVAKSELLLSPKLQHHPQSQ